METEVQRIHDAVKLLGDTALDLATALSSLGSSGPTIAGTGTGLVGSPLTAERFNRMMFKEGVLPAPQRKKVVAPVSYISGKPLGSKARRSKRVSAMVGASKAGYDYKHWCQMMRRVRVDNWKMDMRTFALMLDVTESAVRGWEQGVCFSRAATRWRLEQLTERAHSIKADSWKQSA